MFKFQAGRCCDKDNVEFPDKKQQRRRVQCHGRWPAAGLDPQYLSRECKGAAARAKPDAGTLYCGLHGSGHFQPAQFQKESTQLSLGSQGYGGTANYFPHGQTKAEADDYSVPWTAAPHKFHCGGTRPASRL